MLPRLKMHVKQNNNYSVHTTADGRQIHIFDNAIDYKGKLYFYRFLKSLSYKCVNYDLGLPTSDHEPKLRSDITPQIENDLKFFDSVNSPECSALIKEYSIKHMYVNLGIPTDYNEIHTDVGGSLLPPNNFMTLLYYVNLEWDLNWGGETIFYSEALDSIEYISYYIPGRIIIFDQAIPHSARTQTINANKYRFTLACKLNKYNI